MEFPELELAVATEATSIDFEIRTNKWIFNCNLVLRTYLAPKNNMVRNFHNCQDANITLGLREK